MNPNPYPVNSNTRTCCGGIGGHAPGCSSDDAIRTRSMEYAKRQAAAYALVLERAELSPEDVEVARVVLRKLALVELDDVQDVDFRNEANNFVQDANHLEISLFRAHYRQRIGLT